MKKDTITIIIPFKELNDDVRKCIQDCTLLNYPSFDIIALPDDPITLDLPKVRVIPTGPVFPSIKRNIGIENTDAEFCAFIDSDAYPVDATWLQKARAVLQDPTIGCVGGPNFIPPDAPLREKIGTEILYSRMGVGAFPTKSCSSSCREIKELASSNLIVRSSMFELTGGGFFTGLLTAEDAYLCFMIHNAGFKVIWADDVAVFHHRRHFPSPFLKSVYVYGRDKATLLKLTFSLDKFYYFIPSAFVLFLLFGTLAAITIPKLSLLYGGVLALYFVLVLAQCLFFKPFQVSLCGLFGIPLTHIYYGIGFLYGMTKRYKQ